MKTIAAPVSAWLLLLVLVPAATAQHAPEYAVYGVQRFFDVPLVVGDPLSAASGAFSWDQTLFSLGGPMDLEFSIHYRTDPHLLLVREPGDFPPGVGDGAPLLNAWTWRPAPLIQVEETDQVTVLLDDGNQVCFTNEAGEYVFANVLYVSAGVDRDYQLKRTDDCFWFCDPVRERVTIFQRLPAGDARFWRPVVVLDRHTNRLDYAYAADGDSNPSSIADEEGRRLDFTYETYPTAAGDRRRLAAVGDHAGRTWTFLCETHAPDNGGRTTFRGIEGPDGETWTFRYVPNAFTSPYIAPGTNLSLLVSVVEPLGNATFSNEYVHTHLDPDAPKYIRCAAQTDALGNRTDLEFSFESNRFCGTIAYPNGASNRFEHHYHHDVPPASVRDEDGQTISFTRNVGAHVRSVTDRLGATTFFGHDVTGHRLEGITNAMGQVLRFAWHSVTQEFLNPYAIQTAAFTFEQIESAEFPDGLIEQYAYDGCGNRTTLVDRAGAVWSTGFDARGRPVSERTPTGGETTYAYATNGLLASVADGDGFFQSCGYDSAFRLAAITNADGTARRFEYDAMDRPVRIVDELSQTNAFFYDANGRLLRTVDPLGNEESYQYDAMNRPTNTIHPGGGNTAFAYDPRGRLASLTDPAGIVRTFTRHLDGPVATLAIGGSVWSNAYDAEGILVSTREPSGRTQTFSSDALGNFTNATDGLGNATRIVRDAMQRPVETVDPLDRTTAQTYAPRGELETIILTDGTFSSNTWDSAGNLVAIRDPGGQSWRFNNSPLGRLESIVDPLGRRREFAYDLRGRLAQIVAAAGGLRATNRYAYDAAGRLTNATYADGSSLAFSRDAAGRPAETKGVRLRYDPEGHVTNVVRHGRTVAATYDAAARLVAIDYPDGAFRVVYAYDPTNGLLRRVSDSVSGASVEFEYDEDFLLVTIIRGNGLCATQQLDAAGRLARLTDGDFLDQQVVRDDAGQATQVDSLLPLDPAPALPTSLESHAYDAAAQIADSGYAYDAQGRLTHMPGAAIEWTEGSRLAQLGDVAFEYDGLGALLSRSEGVHTRFYHVLPAIGPMAIVSEAEDATDAYSRHYVWTPDGTLLYSVDPAAGHAVRYYHFDLSGNVVALTDDAGQTTDAYAYAPYGRLLQRTGTSTQPFAFAGRWGVRRDGTNDLYHVGARWYDARTARFLSPEPLWPLIRDPQSLNPYSYARQAPVLQVDPDGMFTTLAQIDHFRELQDEFRSADLEFEGVAVQIRFLNEMAQDPSMKQDLNHIFDSPEARAEFWRNLARMGELHRERNARGQALVQFVAGNRASLRKALARLGLERRKVERRMDDFNYRERERVRAAQERLPRVFEEANRSLQRGDWKAAKEAWENAKAETKRQKDWASQKILQDLNQLESRINSILNFKLPP